MSRNLYEFKHRQYCLTRLENDGRKEPVDIGEYTIEHVLPQNEDLSPEWQAMLGPAWRRCKTAGCTRLGNLTLTGYNPELSDRPFLDEARHGGRLRGQPDPVESRPWQRGGVERGAHREACREALAEGAHDLAGSQVADDVLAAYRKETKSKAANASGEPRPLQHVGSDTGTLRELPARARRRLVSSQRSGSTGSASASQVLESRIP